jgi:hypothetical protein
MGKAVEIKDKSTGLRVIIMLNIKIMQMLILEPEQIEILAQTFAICGMSPINTAVQTPYRPDTNSVIK